MWALQENHNKMRNMKSLCNFQGNFVILGKMFSCESIYSFRFSSLANLVSLSHGILINIICKDSASSNNAYLLPTKEIKMLNMSDNYLNNMQNKKLTIFCNFLGLLNNIQNVESSIIN